MNQTTKTMKILVCKRAWLIFHMAAVIILASSSVLFAQGGVGSTRGLPESSGGSSMLEGKIYLPSGQRAGHGITVKLEGIMIGTRTAITDGDGSFVFRSLPSADYVLVIDGGPEYAVLRQTVTIQGTAAGAIVGNHGQVYSYDLHLVPRGMVIDEQKLFAGVPKEAVADYKKAAQSAQAGNSKKAVEQLNAALAVYPNFTLALSDLGTQYLKLGEIAKLTETMETLLKLSPDDPRAHLNMGIALFNQKKFPEAEGHLRRAIELNNSGPTAHYYLGMTLVSVKKYEEATKELELAVSNGGENIALAHKYLGGLYMGSKNPKAADELEKYLKLDPKAADAERIKGTIKELRSKKP
jgi:thioredoxin-like negative regulator of GroEL